MREQIIAGTFAAALLTMCAACSNQDIYEAVQNNNIQVCQENPQSARERCMERVGEPYESYEQSRRELKEKGS